MGADTRQYKALKHIQINKELTHVGKLCAGSLGFLRGDLILILIKNVLMRDWYWYKGLFFVKKVKAEIQICRKHKPYEIRQHKQICRFLDIFEPRYHQAYQCKQYQKPEE